MQSTSAGITVQARPEAIAFDAARSAIVVVDMQNDFASEGGMFALAGIDVSEIRTVVAPTARVLAAARRAGLPIVYLKMGFRPDLSDAGARDAPNWLKHRRMRVGADTTAPDGQPSRILIRDTWNTEIVRDLAPDPADIVLYKSRYSGFHGTDLDAVLRSRSIGTLIFTGCTTSVCVESTLRDAMFRDYTCLLLADCTAEPVGAALPRTNREASLLVVEKAFGWVAESAELIRAMESRFTPTPET
jgi:ureidoacrylate peracid hydrolase